MTFLEHVLIGVIAICVGSPVVIRLPVVLQPELAPRPVLSKTVDKILKPFLKTVAELEQHSVAMAAEADKAVQEQLAAQEREQIAVDEMKRAVQVKNQLAALFGSSVK